MARSTGWVRKARVVVAGALATALTSAAALESGHWRDGAALTGARSGATASLLNDGRVLFAGGADGATALASAELLGSDASTTVAAMSAPRSRHAAGLLPDGRVLVVGGEMLDGLATDSAELFDPVTSSWSSVPGLSAPRAGHTLTALADGSLLVAGGDSMGVPSALLEVFDPVAESFYTAGVLATPRTGHAAALLDDGRVLIAGGSDGAAALASTEIYDPMTGALSAGPDLLQARTALSATTLIDGRVLVVGGSDGSVALATAEVLDAGAGAFTAVATELMAPRQGHLALRLPNNNNVLIVSGDSPVTPLASAELFTPVTGGFDATGAMLAARALASGAALNADGEVVVGGGADGSGALGSSEIYVFQTIRTDRTDYSPGETVTFIGRRWQPGETVTLVLHETPPQHEVRTLTAVADADGNFTNADYAPAEHDLGTRYVVDAIGQESGLTAQTAFTDGNVTIRSSLGSFSLTRQTFKSANCAGTAGNPPSQAITEAGVNFGIGNNDSERYFAPASGTGPGGTTTSFVGWSCSTGTHFTQSGNSVCVNGTTPSTSVCTASYQASSAATATTVTTTPSPSVFGQAVTANVSVTRTSGASGTPTGSVTVTAATGESCVATLSGTGATAAGSCGLSFTATGARSIAAAYAGNASFAASSGSTSHTVNKANTDVTLTAPANVVVGQTFSATGSVAAVAPGAGAPTGNVQLSNGTSSCSVPAAGGTCVLTAGNAGPATIIATWAGDANFNGSNDSQAQTVAKADTTTTITSDNPDPSVAGQAYTVTWTVTVDAPGAGTPTGTVTVTGGSGCSAPVANGQCTVTSTGAGGVPLTATYSGDANFNLSAAGAAHTVNPAATATVVSSSQNPSIFGEPVQFTAEVCVTGAGSGWPTGIVEFFTGTTSLGTALLNPVTGSAACPTASVSTAGLAAGTHAITAQYASDGNFAASAGTLSQNVSRKAATVKANDKSKTYGDANPAFDATVTGTLGNDTLDYSLGTTAAQFSGVGGYPIKVTLGSNPNYEVTAIDGTLTIQQRGATVTANAKTKLYGDANPALDATVGGTVNGDVLAYTLATTATQFSDVAGYPITVTLGSNPNYNVAATNATLTVQARPATVAAKAKTKTYGDANPVLDATVTGEVAGGTPIAYTLGTTALQFSDVGGYPITVALGSNPNYAVTATHSTLSITAREASVTAHDKTRIYGDANPDFTATVTGEAQGGAPVLYSLSTLADAGSGVGDYAIVVTLGPNPNYTVTPVDGTLTIQARNATVTADAKTKTYGDGNPTLTATVTGTANNDTLNYSLATPAAQFSNVGGYAIEVTLGSNPNYNVTATNGTLTIQQRPATIAANPKTKTYGDANPAFDAEVTGTVNNDTLAYTLGTTAVQFSGVDTYPITVSPGSNPNYVVTPVGSTLTIDPRPATITADPQTKTYGDANPALTVTVTGTVNGDTLAYALGTEAGLFSDVGEYAIVVVPDSNPNYSVAATNGTLTITAREASVTAEDKSKTYGDANPTLTAVVVGEVAGGAPIAYTLSTTAATLSDVDSYPIEVELLSNPNYVVTPANGTLTITRKAATVTAQDKTKTYGDLNPALTATVAGAVAGGAPIQYTLTTTATQFSGVAGSPYAIDVELGDNPNYEIATVSAELAVTPKSATVTASNRSKVYGDVVTFAGTEFTTSGFVDDDAVTSVTLTSTGAGATAGVVGSPYAIVASAAQGSGLDNYTIDYVDGALTVTRKAATVRADDKGKLYGDPNPALTATVTGTVNNDVLAYTLDTAALQLSNVGAYTIAVNLGSNPNYDVTTFSGELLIAPRPAWVTAHAKTRPFGDLNPTLTATVVGQVPGGDPIQYQLATTAVQFSSVAGSPYPITVTLGTNPNYTVGKTDALLTITLRAVVTTVSVSPNPQQYSDRATFTATADAGGLTSPAAAGSVTFKVGTQVIGTDGTADVVDGKLVWTLETGLLEPGYPGNGQMAPGARAVTAEFGGVNVNFDVRNATGSLTISQEDARVTYTGSVFVATGSATTGTATLSATIQDITATADAAGDASFGDIRNATVRFVNRDNGNALLCTAPIGLVSAADTKTGTATCTAPLSTGNSNSASYTVGVIVDGYYTRNSSDDNTLVTVAQGGTGFITGGGYLVMQSSSGIYPGAAGSKNNFGFNVKYNKQRTNLQGHINTIVRNNGRVYQVKGNSMTSLAVQTTTAGGTAMFTGKASIQDITNPLAPVAIDGNASLQVTMTDNGEPGSTDRIGIAVYNKNGGLWFSSNWSGTRTQEQVLQGGNLVVH